MRLRSYIGRFLDPGNLPLLIALSLLLATLWLKPVTMNRPVYIFQIGFDISQSMNVVDQMLDGRAVSRLTYAKATAASLLQALPCGSQVGWSVFTGRRTLTLLTPLDVCDHYAGLSAALEGIDGTMRWSNGSSIGKGIHQIMRTADEYTEPTAVLLMTDGQEAPPLEQGQRGVPNTDKFDVKGLLVGVGGSTPVPIPKTDALGNTVGVWSATDVVQRLQPAFAIGGEELSRRDEERLLALARLTQLDYVGLDSPQALAQRAISAKYAVNNEALTDIRWGPAALALLLLLWQFLPSRTDIVSLIRLSPLNRGTIKDR